MSLVEGEIVTEILKIDPGWWQGIVRDSAGQIVKEGLFPADYVEQTGQMAPVVNAAPLPATFSVRALYDYNAGEDNELSFREGDIISNVEKIAQDWWRCVVL
jgi:hypothetical protein